MIVAQSVTQEVVGEALMVVVTGKQVCAIGFDVSFVLAHSSVRAERASESTESEELRLLFLKTREPSEK